MLLPACVLALHGCAIRPLPEQSTTFNTSAIVRKIRCETREAFRHQMIAWLEAQDKEPAALRVAKALRARTPVAEIDYRGLDPDTAYPISLLAGTAVVYSFNFDMTFTANNSASLDLLDTYRLGKKTLGLGGSINRSRNNKRVFVVADTFGGLYKDLDDDYCDDRNEVPNSFYPITGNIGMDEQVSTFVDMAIFNNLSGKEGAATGPQTMADTLLFTTSLTASADPKIALSPVDGVTAGGLSSSISREDKHQVIVAFALPVPGKNTNQVAEFFGKFLSGSGNATVRRALRQADEAIQQSVASEILSLQ